MLPHAVTARLAPHDQLLPHGLDVLHTLAARYRVTSAGELLELNRFFDLNGSIDRDPLIVAVVRAARRWIGIVVAEEAMRPAQQPDRFRPLQQRVPRQPFRLRAKTR